VKAVREFIDAGFDNVAVVPLVDDLDGFVRFWTEQVRPQLP